MIYKIIIFLKVIFLLTINVYPNSDEQGYDFRNDSVFIKVISSIHLPLGLPYDSTPHDDYIIYRTQYITSYNKLKNAVNWTAWNLNSSWFGNSGRYQGRFIADTSLPEDFLRINHNDYTNSGYDRGHVVRSHERSSSTEDNKSTFLMTNIIPQTPDLNRGVWLDFERYCEELALKHNKELFIYSGAVYSDSVQIGKGITVPDSCFKIVVVLERGEGIDCVNYDTIIISVMMPNINGIRNKKWEDFLVSVRHIEKSSGYNFLPDIEFTIQEVIEQIVYKHVE